MPNLVTGFPRKTGDTAQDVKEFYDWAVSLVDELKQLLNNLDSGNVLEAASVKADNVTDLENFIAEHITAGTIVTNTLIADSLYSDMGSIAELTVDRISTSQAVYKYLAGDVTPDVYFEGYEQGIYFVQGNVILDEVTGEPLTEQLCDRFGNPVWWQKPIVSIVGNIPYDENGDRVLTTRLENTGIPVIVYKYQKNVKLKIEFYTGADGVANPRITLGIGTDPTGQTDNGKAFIEKTAEGLTAKYLKSGDGSVVGYKINDDGGSFLGNWSFGDNGSIAVFSKLPNVMPELEHNTLVCELGEIPGDGVNNITDGQIGSNGDYMLYSLQNVYLYKKQVAYAIAHTPAVNFYSEAAQSMEEIIIPKKLRAYCGHNITPERDYEDFVTVQFMWATVGSAATFNYDTISADDRNFKVYDGLAVCKRLIIPDNGMNFTIMCIGDCPKLEEIVFECGVAIIDNGALAYCPNLHTIRFEKRVHDGFPTNIENVPEIFLPHDFGTESNKYTSLLTNENTAVEKITYHTRGLEHLGGRSGYAWFQGGDNNKVKEIVVPEGTQVFHSTSFSNMPELECVTFPGNYKGRTYGFAGPLLKMSGETYPIFYNCPNLKKFRCRQSQSEIISAAEENGLEVEYID